MYRLILLLAILCSAQTTSAQSKDAQIVEKLNAQWLNCYLTKDTTTLSTILADDFFLINPKVDRFTKADVLANITKQETLSIQATKVEATVLTADVIVLTVFASFQQKSGDKVVKGENCYQDVYQKRHDKWQAVTAHVTLLKME